MALANELIYKNVIGTFFVIDRQRGDRENLISERATRLGNGIQFVLDNIPNPKLSKKLHGVVSSKVGSMEITFYKKWRESKCKSKMEFERQFGDWINLKLPVNILSV